MLHTVVTLAIVILAFGFIIFVHELGHFSVAKSVGIKVHEFALGFGPRLFGWRRGDTEYALRAVPFGGYVRMEGEDDPNSDPDDPGSLQNQPFLSQIAVLGGGCFMNYLSALVVLICIGFLVGIPDMTATASTVVGSVIPGGPAATAGIQAKDRIVAVDGHPVSNFTDITLALQDKAGNLVHITVERGKEQKTLDVTPKPVAVDGKTIGRIDIKSSMGPSLLTPEFVPAKDAREVFASAGYWLVKVTVAPFQIVSMLIHHQVSGAEVAKGVGGPILIGKFFYDIAHRGAAALLFLWAIICASVGGFNLLPVPALDGSRILFTTIGAVRGRPLDPKKEGMVHMVGLMVLLAVMLVVSIGDIAKIISGVKFFS